MADLVNRIRIFGLHGRRGTSGFDEELLVTQERLYSVGI
jgi:hypothetical protein